MGLKRVFQIEPGYPVKTWRAPGNCTQYFTTFKTHCRNGIRLCFGDSKAQPCKRERLEQRLIGPVLFWFSRVAVLVHSLPY